MKFPGEVLLFVLLVLIVIIPASATSSQGPFQIDTPLMKYRSITDEWGNTAHTITMVANGNAVTTQGMNEKDAASVEQHTRATGSVIFARSVAIDAGGNVAETQLSVAGNASMDTQQKAGANQSGASAGQETSMEMQGGYGYAGTSAQSTDGGMNTSFTMQGTGTVSTVQSGSSGKTAGESTLGLKQRTSLALVKGQAHTRLSAPDTLWTYRTSEDFSDDVRAESDQQVRRTTNATDFSQNASSLFTGETGDGSYHDDIYIHFDDPPTEATDHTQVELTEPKKYTVKKLTKFTHNFPADSTSFTIDTEIDI